MSLHNPGIPRLQEAVRWDIGYPRWLVLPVLLWMGVLFVVPLVIVLLVSFSTRGTYGGVIWHFTLDNYLDLLHPLYGHILGQSFFFAAATTVLCLIIGYPFAYYMARMPQRRQFLWLMLVLVPFWTNFLVRTYAWMLILRTEGLANSFLMNWGLIDEPLPLLYTPVAVLFGLVYGYLPFMILPLYVACERLDPVFIDAAKDLYASRTAVFWRVIWPLTRPGVIAGSILVFIPSIGAFITPDLLGGARSMMVGNLIQHEYLVVRDWPLGSAVSFLLIGVVMALSAAYMRVDRRVRSDGSDR